MDGYDQELGGGSTWDVNYPISELDEGAVETVLEEEYIRLSHRYDSLRDVGRIEEANAVLVRIHEIEEMLGYSREGKEKPPIIPER